MKFRVKDPFSGFSHLLGAILSIIGLVVLIKYALTDGTVWHLIGFSIYGTSLILLYTASSVYHLVTTSEKNTKILRKLDHTMIYVLIAGTYTPVCLIPLRGGWGWSLLISIWAIAMIGITLKLLWFNAPRWLYTMFYVIMGWMIILAFFPLVKTVPLSGVLWLIIGGLMYTIGAIIYGTKWSKLNFKRINFHDIFHIFVLYGSLCHFWLMFKYVLYIK